MKESCFKSPFRELLIHKFNKKFILNNESKSYFIQPFV